MQHEAVFYTTKPPANLIHHFHEIDENFYVFGLQPYCYDNKASAYYHLGLACDFATLNDDDSDELYKFISKHCRDLEFEETTA